MEAWQTPPPRQTVLQGPYRRRIAKFWLRLGWALLALGIIAVLGLRL